MDQGFLSVKIKSSLWKFNGWYHYVSEDVCHKWHRIWSVCCNHNHNALFMTYHRVSNKSNTTSVNIGTWTFNLSWTPWVYSRLLVWIRVAQSLALSVVNCPFDLFLSTIVLFVLRRCTTKKNQADCIINKFLLPG